MTKGRHIDYVILITVLTLTIFGFAVLASASSDLGKLKFDDTYYYLRHQLLYGFSFGLLGFIGGLLIPYKFYKKWAVVFLVLTLVALLLTLTPLGFSSGGAKRWLQFGPIIFQPAELLKITFILYISAWLVSHKRLQRQTSLTEGFLPFLTILSLIAFLFLFQKSTSIAAILLSSVMAVYFVGGAKKRYLAALFLIAVLIFSTFIVLTPYRIQRIATFLNPSGDIQGASYQLNQALLTIGSGGLLGVGYGESLSKSFLPERIGDSIFAIIAEEFGFVGAILLISAFFILVGRGYILAKKISDPFGKLILVGFSTVIGIQMLIHIGSNSGLFPLTGVPLPFISYGGTALAVYLTMAGIMLNITRDA